MSDLFFLCSERGLNMPFAGGCGKPENFNLFLHSRKFGTPVPEKRAHARNTHVTM